MQGICPFLGRAALFKATSQKLYAFFDTVGTALSETSVQLLDSFVLELCLHPSLNSFPKNFKTLLFEQTFNGQSCVDQTEYFITIASDPESLERKVRNYN